ncbi:hypothetical protein LEP1GSC132_0376 [Leptospira kirschneri str. 200803703]|uniref:Uncharacterized protein n=1 Tax=Leptospira kirschneri str. 200802841 TaxID=1193047 RepID=A0A828Y8R6_9LEPT|nr:hypothetical protein LEP1GSC131_0392 [Leptospira kirschneri str. 200802841]EKP03347.1 hypothetical protein LEP1GSC018_3332 [Leptospira kirschneri str. 2008720114]EMK06013.1 hypothetical protein LEP1GSC176_1490 [Leptospira kirschneri str. MMD1493]EMN05036.1 hypothetical protein LEP1GSC046_3602 [Leptospira kirschneri serovar Bim str. 1051]EMO68688.1 hypothetical protein LEP1GSC132_0376 [Leptospira kirschneri str. 200803703]EMO81343.1 hypothetical protein LEP1GSC126_2419 [Leptospira kirschneri
MKSPRSMFEENQAEAEFLILVNYYIRIYDIMGRHSQS